MVDLNSTTLIITLNMNGLNSLQKGGDYQNRYKKQLQLYVVYKKCSLKTQIN